MAGHRKLVHHDHDPGDLHELTFSCYQRRQLLIDDAWRRLFCETINHAVVQLEFRLVAFVLMPEHIHLLTYPTNPDVSISRFLWAIKRPHSSRIKSLLQEIRSPLLDELTVRERPGKFAFRYWQEGSGYDRNMRSESSVMAAIDYIHLNPVRRKLVLRSVEWKWSSARWYASEGNELDPDLPVIHGLPPQFFD